MNAREIRDLIEQTSTGTRRRRFAPEVKRAVLRFAREGRAQGESWVSLGRQLGLDGAKLRAWCREARGPEVGVIQPVEVVDTPASAPLSVVAPSGVRIEGLSVAGAAELLRLLG
jgi:hypothetical protein